MVTISGNLLTDRPMCTWNASLHALSKVRQYKLLYVKAV
jgi:hypothetical protein